MSTDYVNRYCVHPRITIYDKLHILINNYAYLSTNTDNYFYSLH